MGCGGAEVIVRREIVPELPPDVLLVDVDQPAFSGRTYGDAVRFIPVLQASHQMCTNQIGAVREWVESRRADRLGPPPGL